MEKALNNDQKFREKAKVVRVEPRHMPLQSHPRPVSHRKVQTEDQIPNFWIFYTLMTIGSLLPVIGVLLAFIVFSFAKTRFFKFLPLVISLAANAYFFYLRQHSGSVFHLLKNAVH
ncbi:hypothetical protein EHO60_14540 [Leptospira fletcheri]|uniref:Uncharacterized protein n=1 Tax=Leptospira fletcheri TaxID=2484981 RepID=A0A4R9GAC0_9LEPT|nr:hypothetical protein [Leptospira fletcheri]TGK08573.1 hypothetical protein EHO60_14540 [Leptospira fletcheri]